LADGIRAKLAGKLFGALVGRTLLHIGGYATVYIVQTAIFLFDIAAHLVLTPPDVPVHDTSHPPPNWHFACYMMLGGHSDEAVIRKEARVVPRNMLRSRIARNNRIKFMRPRFLYQHVNLRPFRTAENANPTRRVSVASVNPLTLTKSCTLEAKRCQRI